MNLRHTVPADGRNRPANAYWNKCLDLDKWREMKGTMIFKIPPGGWRWKQDPAFSTAMHRVLSEGERCATVVRELGGTPQQGRAMAKSVRRALILAVSEYECVPKLPNAVNDAIALRKALQVHIGMQL